MWVAPGYVFCARDSPTCASCSRARDAALPMTTEARSCVTNGFHLVVAALKLNGFDNSS
jgi:hypothetical protein